MAARVQRIGAGVALSGAASAALVLFLTIGTLIAVAVRAEDPGTLGLADWRVIRFTLWQALLSAGISCLLAVPLARALARRRFPGRALLVTLLGAPFILPVIVAILGVLAVFGRQGWVNLVLAALGLPRIEIYGLAGILIVHVFFNLPLATRLLLQGWLAIPGERFRLAESLGMGPAEIARHFERPLLRAILPGAFAVIFLICLTSFAVALTLGGGPRATTVELAIYQAVRWDFDLGKAALLAAVQYALCAGAALLVRIVSVPAPGTRALDLTVPRHDARRPSLRLQDGLVIGTGALFLLTPLAALLVRGLPALAALPPGIGLALGHSLAVAAASTGLTLAAALALSLLAVRAEGRWWAPTVEATGYLSVAASSLVVGTGLFLILLPWTDPTGWALPVTALVNALMSLPFALRALLPAVRETERAWGRLADSLGMSGQARLRLLLLPRIRRPLGFAAGLAAALSIGDLGVIALFGTGRTETLPLAIYRLMGSYRMEAATGAAVLLTIVSLAVFWLCDRGGRLGARA